MRLRVAKLKTLQRHRRWLGMLLVVLAVAAAFLVNRGRGHAGEAPFPGSNGAIASDSGAAVSFLALGDTGHGDRKQKRVAHAMSAVTAHEPIHFVLLLGDNFYEDGIQARDGAPWSVFFDDIYRLPGLSVPFFAVLGNHDHNGSVAAQVEHTAVDARWRMPAPYYSWTVPFDDAEALFIALDTQTLIGRNIDHSQLAWLERTLAESSAAWKIVFGHHPILLSPEAKVQPSLANLVELFDRYGVATYFCGHKHELAFFKRPGGVSEIISGTGSDERPIEGVSQANFAVDKLGFACVRLTRQAMLLSFMDAQGRLLWHDSLQPPTPTRP